MKQRNKTKPLRPVSLQLLAIKGIVSELIKNPQGALKNDHNQKLRTEAPREPITLTRPGIYPLKKLTSP